MQKLDFTKRQMYNYSLRLKESLKLSHRIIATLLGKLKSRAVSYALLCARIEVIVRADTDGRAFINFRTRIIMTTN